MESKQLLGKKMAFFLCPQLNYFHGGLTFELLYLLFLVCLGWVPLSRLEAH